MVTNFGDCHKIHDLILINFMYESKLITILRSLNIEEKRKLRKWINSDFVNKNEDILLFFKFIDGRKRLNSKSVTKEKAHDFLYPNTPFNDLRIRHLMWMSTEIVESFIIHLTIENELSLKEKLLSKYYFNKGLYTYANKIIENAIEDRKKVTIKNADFYRNSYELGYAFYDINSRNNRAEDFRINESIRSFTAYSIIEVLKSACAVNTIQKVMEVNTQQYLLQPILDMLPNSIFLELPIVRIYYNTYLVAANEDENAFEIFVTDIKQNENLFSIQDLNGLYRTAINFCIKKSNQNIKYYTQKTFELYLYTIENGILIENNEINRFIFTNTITLGIKLANFIKAESFMKKYSDYVNAEFRENTIDYNNAKILYAKKQYNNALNILLTNEFKDTIWNLNAKLIISKIYFETEELKAFEMQLKAFKIYIKRKSNIGYHKTYFTNVTDALTKLLEIYKKPNKYKGFTFDNTTPDIDWFNKMLDGIKTKKTPK